MPLKCYHCNETIPTSVDIKASINGNIQPMCCYGCKAVAEMIAESGLSQYYSLRTTPASRIDQTDDKERFALFDQPAYNNEFVNEQQDGVYCADLLIEGVSCAACTWLIENSLRAQSGTTSASVSLQDKRLRVKWDSKNTKLSALVAVLARLGYQAKPYLADTLKESQRIENHQFLKRLGVAFIGMMQVGMFAIGLHAGDISYIEDEWRDLLRWVSALVATPVVFYSAGPFFSNAWRSLKAKSAGMDLPVSLAIGIAYSFSLFATLQETGDVYFDSIIMFTFLLLLGRYLEMRARHRLGDPATALRALLPRTATIIVENETQLIAIHSLQPQHIIIIKPGEIIAADSEIIEGRSNVDESTFTGESLPQAKKVGDTLLAGTLNIDSPLKARVIKNVDQSRLNNVYDMLVNAQANKPSVANLTDKLAVKFVILIITLSILTATYWFLHDTSKALWIALSVLVVSCPCALSLSTPTALTAAITRLKDIGILVISGDIVDKLNQIDRIIFDKTGTLTHGKIQLAQTVPCSELDEASCIALAKALEKHSEHPIARAFKVIPGPDISIENIQQFTAAGVVGQLDGHIYRVGRIDFACNETIAPPSKGQWVALSKDYELLAWFELLDTLRSDAKQAIAKLNLHGYKIDILSGDDEHTVANIAQQLGVESYFSKVSPEDKLHYLKSRQDKGERVLMVGDGINDIAVLAGADASIAMGMASELAKTHADMILLGGELCNIDQAIAIAARCRRVIKQNIVWALLYNVFAIPLAMIGSVLPYQAAIGMSLSSLIVVINALRFKGKM